jgi:hypothetical protein
MDHPSSDGALRKVQTVQLRRQRNSSVVTVTARHTLGDSCALTDVDDEEACRTSVIILALFLSIDLFC